MKVVLNIFTIKSRKVKLKSFSISHSKDRDVDIFHGSSAQPLRWILRELNRLEVKIYLMPLGRMSVNG